MPRILVVLSLFLSSLALASPEEETGCGPTQTPAVMAKAFCARYQKLRDWHGSAFEETYGLARAEKACLEFAESSARLRNVMCAYYKQASAFGELAEKVPDAPRLATARAALHEKFRALLVHARGEQLLAHQALRDAFPVDTYVAQLRREAYSCEGGNFSSIPGPWLVATLTLTRKEAGEIFDKFQEASWKSLRHAVENAAAPRAPASYDPPSLVEEWWWAIFGDRATEVGVSALERLALTEAQARWANKFAGPLLGFVIGISLDYYRSGSLDMSSWISAFCGLGGLSIGLVCTTVLTLLEIDRERMAAYGRFSSDYLATKPKAKAQEVSHAFCEWIENNRH